jgi:hypothetical protein
MDPKLLAQLLMQPAQGEAQWPAPPQPKPRGFGQMISDSYD